MEFVAVIFFLRGTLKPSPQDETTEVDVGAFYYVWYDEGYGNLHWSDRIEWTVVDEPILGYYNSCDPATIKQHFAWFEELKIDFVIVSWWGFYNQTEEVSFINKAVHQVFKVVDENTFKVKLVVMVEPFNENKTYGYYDYQQIYDYVYSNFAGKYPYLYFNYQGKPLICFFNAPFLTKNGYAPKDSRFKTILVGHHYEDYCIDWVFEHITPHWTGEVPHGRVYSVCPRYDDSRLGRPQNYTIDPDYSQQVYQREWGKALDFAQKKVLDIVLINSWNEFNERSQIEPCHDATSEYADPYYLFNATKTYTYELKGLNQQNNSGWPELATFGLVILLIISTVFILLYAFRRHTH